MVDPHTDPTLVAVRRREDLAEAAQRRLGRHPRRIRRVVAGGLRHAADRLMAAESRADHTCARR